MYKMLTQFVVCDLPVARRSRSRVIVRKCGFKKVLTVLCIVVHTNSSWQKKQLVLQVPLFLLAGISTLNCTILYIHATQVAN